MTAYYNEIDPFAVAWLRELIREGVIADGIVDDRSIELVEPRDLDGFTQCHFFAGIGVWSYALRLAGWPDDRPVWTGSCPCQPFSVAGKTEGFTDPRHLWPAWFRLARVCRPDVLFGEQVERAIRLGWFDLVSSDLEAEGYAVGSTVFGSHSVGAPHIRQRLYFVADAGRDGARQHARELPRDESEHEVGLTDGDNGPLNSVATGPVADADKQRRVGFNALLRAEDDGRVGAEEISQTAGRRPTGGFWADAEWVDCTDGKARPVEPGSFPLAYGSPVRVGRLRGYGNAINARQAQAFIEAYLSISPAKRHITEIG